MMESVSFKKDRRLFENILGLLSTNRAIQNKISIDETYAMASPLPAGWLPIGDDCSAIPDEHGGYLLLAAEGMLEEFVRDDPWFAGYSAVMVNISDVCAMGGRPLAVVDVVWAPDKKAAFPIWEGMLAASEDYSVPIVGGHTNWNSRADKTHLAVSVLGRAGSLLTSEGARPGDTLLMAVDLSGSYRGGNPFWNSSVGSNKRELWRKIEILPRIAEKRWCNACKDISNGGVVGTLIMLLQSSNVGAQLELDRLPRPPEIGIERWLITFPSFGYLLSVPTEHRDAVIHEFVDLNINCTEIGKIISKPMLKICLEGQRRIFWTKDSASARAGRSGR